jgi:hypothetical protein
VFNVLIVHLQLDEEDPSDFRETFALANEIMSALRRFRNSFPVTYNGHGC